MEYQGLGKNWDALARDGNTKEACNVLEEEIAYNLALVHNFFDKDNEITPLQVFDIQKFNSYFGDDFKPFRRIQTKLIGGMARTISSADQYEMKLQRLVELREKLDAEMKNF